MTRKRVPRVAFVSHSPWIAGAERVLLNLLQNLPEGEIQPVTIFPLTDGPVKSLAKQTLPFPMFELPYGFTIPTYDDSQLQGRIQRETAAFTNLFRELELDAVVVNTAVLYPASAAAVRARIPLLVHCHGAILHRAFPRLNMAAWHPLDVLQYYMADMVLTPSRWVGDHLRTVCKVSESHLRVLFNGTELPVIDDQDLESAKTGPPEFVMLCTLEPHKGVNVFLEAAAAFLSIRPSSARFVAYGEGSPQYRGFLEATIRRYNLQDHFILRPKQEVDSIYRRCCAVVVTAEFEPFSMVVIEGMSYAKPVIATRCGGPEEILEDGKTGFLIAVGDSQALAERMLTLVDSPRLRREIGLAARLRAESVYDIKLIARQYLDVILSVVDSGCGPAVTERKRFLEAMLDADPVYPWPSELQAALESNDVLRAKLGLTQAELETTTARLGLERQEVAAARKDMAAAAQEAERFKTLWSAANRSLSTILAEARIPAPAHLVSAGGFLIGRQSQPQLPEPLIPLREYSNRHFHAAGSCLVLSGDLSEVSYKEYIIPIDLALLTSVSLAIRPLLTESEGIAGIEIVTGGSEVLAHVRLPLAGIRGDGTTEFKLPAPIAGLQKNWLLRVFVRENIAPVSVYELARGGLLRGGTQFFPLVFLK